MKGQALTEMVLGLLVFVTILLFGIHFAEIGYLSIKVHEAQASAIWESTGRRAQTVGVSAAPFAATPGLVGSRATATFRDFDALQANADPPVITKALTRASNLTVTCREDNSLNWRPTRTVDNANVYFDRGGLNCTARANIQAVRIPTAFVDSGGGSLFKAEHRRLTPIPICGLGSGDCNNGRLGILTNDWGLAGDNERGDCMLSGCANPIYRNAVGRMFIPAGSSAHRFATIVAGAAPDVGNQFWFSFAGFENAYTQPLASPQGNLWNTGGAGMGLVPATTGSSCFLGQGC